MEITWLTEITSFIGYTALALGMIMLNWKNIWGWWVYFFGSVIWFANGFLFENYNMIAWNVIFGIININGWRKWRREGL
jgi:hypothetical protein